MHSNTLLIALTMGISCLAAPLAVPKAPESVEIQMRDSAAASGEVTAQGWGQVRRESSKDAEVSTNGWGQVRNAKTSDSGSVHTNGWGQVRKESVEAEAKEDSPALSKRTGYGIISGGTDEA